jgi:hypothetical protein
MGYWKPSRDSMANEAARTMDASSVHTIAQKWQARDVNTSFVASRGTIHSGTREATTYAM